MRILKKATLQNDIPTSYELHEQLRSIGCLDKNEQFIYDNIMSGLSRYDMPTQFGNDQRLAEYHLADKIPWSENINCGDIVTNHTQFMSVSSSDKYIQYILTDGYLTNQLSFIVCMLLDVKILLLILFLYWLYHLANGLPKPH